VDTSVKSAFRVDLLSVFGIPSTGPRAATDELARVRESGVQKNSDASFPDSILLAKKKTCRVGIDSKNTSSLCILELKVAAIIHW
jgi:hypothetical protein